MSKEGQVEAKSHRREGDTEVQKFLNFSIGVEEYGLELLKVKEVIALPDITSVPYMPPHFRGIMNLRGQVISVLDLRTMFKMKPSENSAEMAVIILEIAEMALGIIVDSVNSVLAIDGGDIQTPSFDIRDKPGCITGIVRREGHLVLVLDIERTISPEELRAMRNVPLNTASNQVA